MRIEERGPSFRLDGARLDDEVAASVGPASLAAGVLMTLVAPAHLIVLSPHYRVPMAVIAGVVAAVFLATWGMVRARPVPRGRGHAFVALASLLLVGHGLALLAFTHEPRQTSNLMIVGLAGGMLLLSHAWLGLVLATSWLGFFGAAALSIPDGDWIHFGWAFFGVTVLSFVLVTTRRRMFERLYSREAALASTLKDLQRSNEALEEFAYAVSHDLQAPIRAISGYATILREEHDATLDADARACVGKIEQSAVHMGELVRDLLEYARVGSRGVEFKVVSLDAALDRALDNLRGDLARQGAEVLREPLPKVSGDELQLVQLLQNLVSNAVKFRGAEPPKVRIAARRQGPDWIVSVADNGIGVAPEFHERIFRVFERLHSGSAYPGTGIGLATCKRVVERHGGQIWVESVEGQGATFSFSVPASGAA